MSCCKHTCSEAALCWQELLKDMERGKSDPGTSRPSLEIKKGAEPFISGTFEYGLGRMAGGQKTYLFINKAQDQLKLHDAMVQFLGVYKTNKKVCRLTSIMLGGLLLYRHRPSLYELACWRCLPPTTCPIELKP